MSQFYTFLERNDFMTELVSSISRSDTIPIVKQIEVTKNKGYLTLDVSSFTPRMFYELPAIRFEVYTETNGTRVKYNTVDNVIRTYQPELFPDHEKIVVCIKNIPNTCYLYITPIFDDNAVPARNMLIENGIETGDLWDIVPTSTFPITIGFDGQTEPGYPTTTITGVPPISFRSDGTELTSWSISGQILQTGTPTPSAPIQPEECGDRTANLFDLNATDTTNGYVNGAYLLSDGSENENAPYRISEYIEIHGSTAYTLVYGNSLNNPSLCFYDSSKQYISGQKYGSNRTVTVTSPSNAKYIRISYTYTVRESVMLNTGSTAQPFEPFGYKLTLSLAGQTQNIYLSEPLRKIGDYGDTVNSDGTVTRRIKCIDLGDKTWNKAGSGNFNAYLGDGLVFPNSTVCPAYCDIFKAVSADNYASTSYSFSTCINNESRIVVNKTGFEDMTADDFKTAMLGHKSWYVLATPTTETVTVPTLTPTKGSNTLSVGTTLQPSEISITGGIRQQ